MGPSDAGGKYMDPARRPTKVGYVHMITTFVSRKYVHGPLEHGPGAENNVVMRVALLKQCKVACHRIKSLDPRVRVDHTM